MLRFIFLFIITLLSVNCADQSIQKYQKRAQIEQEGSNRAENENQRRKAIAMEETLQKRYHYYIGLSAEYHGQFTIQDNQYLAKLIFTPSFHLVPTERIRTLEEIQEDINNLYLNAQFILWDSEGKLGSQGCIYEKVKTNMLTGQIELFSTNCPARMTILFSQNGTQKESRHFVSKKLTEELLAGSRNNIPQLDAVVNSIHNQNGYEIIFIRQNISN